MAKHMNHPWLLLLALLMSANGCGSSTSSSAGGGGSSMDELAGQVDAQNAARNQQEAAAAAKAAADQKAAEAQAAQTPVEPERTAAGRAQLQQGGGYYSAIVGARRHVLNRVDDLAWTQGVQHFQATEGRLPKDHAEFMSKIIVPLGINLGHIEEGQEFLYDPKGGTWGEVYVVAKIQEPAK